MSGDLAFADARLYFTDYGRCRDFIVQLRWPGGKIKCPECGSERVCYLARSQVWKCYVMHPKPRFSLKTGTIFGDSPIGLDKWLLTAWALTSGGGGVSSYELSRALGVSQKTAWFMQHRIRLAMQSATFQKAPEPVENAEAEVNSWEAAAALRQFRSIMGRLLNVSKAELDRRVREAKLGSDRIDDPRAPGRKRKWALAPCGSRREGC